MKHTIILGHPDCRNKGDEAVLLGLIKGINSVYPSLRIVIPSYAPEYDRKYIPEGPNNVTFSEYWRPPFLMGKIIRKLRRTFGQTRPKKLDPIDRFIMAYRSCIKASEFVVFSGKDLFCEDYGEESLYWWMDRLSVACDLNERVYLWGVSAGPFSNKNERNFKELIDRVSMITPREARSFEYICTLSNPEKCHLMPDPAFAVPASKPTEYTFPLKEEKNNRIGFSISGGLVRYRDLDKLSYLEIFKDTIIDLNRSYDIEILFVPHVAIGEANNDYVVSQELKDLLFQYKIRVILPPPDLKATEYKYMIESCDLFVGTRAHTMIAALAAGVPTIGIAYSVKTYGILEEFYGDTRWVIDIADLNADLLSERIQSMMKSHETIVRDISKKANAMKTLVNKGWALLEKWHRR